MDGANHHAEGFNPLCGDRVTIYLLIQGDTIRDIGFEGSGCAICTASSSLMTDALKGKSLSDIEQMFGRFHALVTSDSAEEPNIENLGKLAVFSGVREYPIRVKCATLPWHTLRAAIKDKSETVTTE